MNHEESILREEMAGRGSVLVKTLAELSREPLLNYQISRLEMQVDSMKTEQDVVYARVVNSNFLVLADTRREQEGWTYSGRISESTRIIFQDSVLIASEPIKIIGSVHGMAEIAFSLDALQEKIRRNSMLFILIFISELLLSAGFAVFLEVQVIRPLHLIVSEVEQISADSNNNKLVIPGMPSVEILKVSRAIDNMREKIRKNQEDLISKTKLATLGKIGSNLAHEIRNPLEAISGAVEILGSDQDTASSDRIYLEIIKEEIHNLNDYLTGFLEFSRQEPGDRREACPADLVHDSLLLLSPLFRKNRITIYNNASGCSDKWMGDPNQLKRVILNLLLNSIEAIGMDGNIFISTRLDDGIKALVLYIEDDGGGIADSDLEKVFDLYFSTKKDGSGIGLPLCRKIISEHEGKIEISNRRDGGTTVSISLPVHEGSHV